MATVNNKNTKNNNTSSENTSNIKIDENLTTITKLNDELRAENKNLQDMLMELSKKLETLCEDKEKTGIASNSIDFIDADLETDNYEYEEPSANKQIKIMSVYHGSLNLCNNSNRSIGKILHFSKFGEIKSVLYHDLVDYVNNERRFAEEGYFYILDKNAVYALGLSSEYKHIMDANILNNIMKYTESQVHSIVEVMTDAQKETLASLIAQKLYNNVNIDMNKLAVIEKVSGIDIHKKVNEMKMYSPVKKEK